MSKKSREFIDQVKSGEQITVMDIVKETFQAITPGLSPSKIFSDIGDELKHLGAQGAHELASALFRGDPYVMYPHAGKEAEAHGVHGETVKQPEVEQERGGMEM